MKERRQLIVTWAPCVVWAGLGLMAAVMAHRASGGQAPLAYLASIVIAGAVTGWAAGRLLAEATRRIGRYLTGGLAGHGVFAPPAVQVGQWTAGLAVEFAAVQNGIGGLAVYALALVAVATAVLSIGAAVGMALEAAVRLAVRRLLPQRLLAGLSGIRFGWKGLRIAVLVAMLAGTLVYADRKGGIPWPEAGVPAVSGWIEGEKTLFRAVLEAHRYDVLVLPMQVDGASFDRAARSLMTRYLAQRVAERTGQRLPDPTLVARAFGVRARQIDLQEALRHAESLGVQTVLDTQVRRTGQTFRVKAQVWTRSGDKGRWGSDRAAEMEGLHFHDRLPPSVSFRESIDDILDVLKLGTARVATPQAPRRPGTTSPIGDLLKLAQRGDAPALERALDLQVLASLHVVGSLEAEVLWERSLVALWRAPRESPLNRVLEARAYLHLGRRPYAIEILGQPDSPAAQALLALMNADVPGVEAVVEGIDDRALKMITELELADLYWSFGLTARYNERRKGLLDRAWTDVAAIKYRLWSHERSVQQVHGDVAAALGRTETVRHDVTETVAAYLHWLYWRSDPLSEHGIRFARSIERVHPRAWQAKADKWAAHAAADRLAEWDYYDLLFAMNREAAIRTAYLTLWLQRLPARAVALIEGLYSVLPDHPHLAYLHAYALDELGYRSAGGPRARLYSKSTALAVSAYRWEGGESRVSSNAEGYIYEREYEKYDDEPLRWYRKSRVQRMRGEFERLSYAKHEMEREIAVATRRLAYSAWNVAPLNDLVTWLRRAGRAEEVRVVLREQRHRFVGSIARADFLAELGDGGWDGKDMVVLYETVLRLDPNSWRARWQIARAHMETGRLAEAQKILLDYPGFAHPNDRDIVGLSNNAYTAGHLFYRKGETILAEPFFIFARNLRTGAGSEMRSRELLAIMGNDMDGAVSEARRQLDRYNDGGGAMRYLSYLFLLGRGEQAWSEFMALVNRFDTDVWRAAFLAHRMQGSEGKAVETWLAQEASRDTRRSYLSGALRERHAFMIALIDRPASEEALEAIRRVVQANNRSYYYPQLAAGYVAFRRGEYAAAAKNLVGLHNDLFNISMNRRESYNELLPYLALAYWRSGQRAEAEKVLQDHRINLGEGADYLVARALIHGASGEHDAAISALKLAFHRLPRLNTRAFFPGYTLLESCEMLLKESGNEAYRAMIEDFARRLQVDFPYSWAAAFEAKYARNLDNRQLAIAAASILDPNSERIRHIPESERAALRGAAGRHASVLGAAIRHSDRRR